jgi:hypothetical protein
MPNQRAKNKVFLGGFIDRALLVKLTRTAKAAGMETNRFGLVRYLLEKGLEKGLDKGLVGRASKPAPAKSATAARRPQRTRSPR